MIAVGTLCLLINGHELEGKVCTVVGPLRLTPCGDRHGFAILRVHDIEVGVPCPAPFRGWVAKPTELVPITPPCRDVSRETTESLSA